MQRKRDGHWMFLIAQQEMFRLEMDEHRVYKGRSNRWVWIQLFDTLVAASSRLCLMAQDANPLVKCRSI